jgi:hypothetical protein
VMFIAGFLLGGYFGVLGSAAYLHYGLRRE